MLAATLRKPHCCSCGLAPATDRGLELTGGSAATCRPLKILWGLEPGKQEYPLMCR